VIAILAFQNAKECDDHFNNLSPSDSDNNDDTKSLFDEGEDDGITNVSTMTIPQTPQLQSTVELNNTISDLLRLLLTQEVTLSENKEQKEKQE
jgi:hypothetical protein